MNGNLQNKVSDFIGLITEQEYLRIEKHCLFHPILDLFRDCCSSNNYEGFRYFNTLHSFRLIKQYDKKWIDNNKNIIIGKDISSSSAKLGELRCYGYLMEAFLPKNVKCIPENDSPTPDFVVNIGDTAVSFEVNTLNINGDEFQKMVDFSNCLSGECSIAPYGRKKAKTINENVIHKLTQTKGEEHQLACAKHHVLWIDVQNEEMNILGERANASGPIFTGLGTNGIALYSNELWYACYGRIGDALFENIYLSNMNGGIKTTRLPRLRHNGRFAYKSCSKYEMIFFSFPNAVIAYENPFYCKFPNEFYNSLFSLNRFSLKVLPTKSSTNTGG